MNPNGGFESDPEYSETEVNADSSAVPAASYQLPEQERPVPFENWAPLPEPPVRVPNFGHFGVLILLAAFGLLASSLAVRAAVSIHLFGVSTLQQAVTEIHYVLGSEVILYTLTFLSSLLIFPFLWHKSLFAGVQWNGAKAVEMRLRLFGAASGCFVFAILNAVFLPGPSNTPIDQIFRAPGAAWLMFAFGVTIAPFFEEFFFRGFLLPALCTACDWTHERTTHTPPLPLAENGHPQWSTTAMIIGSVLTSVPFALTHAQQIGSALGPLALLFCVSLILCWTRLATRSLAASVLVHASYNFLIFSFMLLSTSGFRHLDKL